MGIFDLFRRKEEKEKEEIISTPHQARVAYSNPCLKGREVWKTWNSLARSALEKIIRANNVNEFFCFLFSGDFPNQGEACDLARSEVERMISLIETTEQAKTIVGVCRGSSFLGVLGGVGRKWEELSLIEVEEATNGEEIKKAIMRSRYNGKAFVRAFSRWTEFCQTFSDIEHLSDFFYAFSSFSLSDEVVVIIDRKKESILFAEIPKNTNRGMAKIYYDFAPKASAVKVLAFENWLGLCTTPEEADEAYRMAYSQMCIELAYQRVKELSLH